MKRGLKISAISIVLLSFTQLSLADIQTEEQSVESSQPKPLKVEKGATKVGEEKSEAKVKTRSLKMEYANDTAQSGANMNIGKVEFYVK
jgi:hypothetical protein